MSKEMIERIKKLAQEIPTRTSPRRTVQPSQKTEDVVPSIKHTKSPPLSGAAPDVPTRGAQPNTLNQHSGTPKTSSNIKEMQVAIQNFAAEAVMYKSAPKGKPAPTDKRKHFNDFLAEQYSEKSKIHGKEWTPSEKATTIDSKQPTEIIELDNVISNLRRIGPGAKEMFADGTWGPRTDNTLRNIYAFADAMVTSSNEFGSRIAAFTKYDLQAMKTLINSVYYSKSTVQKLDAAAKKLTPLINKLTDFYKEYSKFILSHPGYVQYIENDAPLFVIKPQSYTTEIPKEFEKYLSPTEINKLFLYDVSVANAAGAEQHFMQLPLSILLNTPALTKFMVDSLGYSKEQVTDPANMTKVLDSITESVTRKGKSQNLQVAKKDLQTAS